MKKNSPTKGSLNQAATPSEPKIIGWDQNFWRIHWLPALLLMACAFLLYFPTLSYDYVLDDKIVITDNSYTKQGFKGIGKILSTESFQGYFLEQKDLVVGGRYRPLSLVTFAIEYQIFGLNPAVSHFINILLYGLTGVLILRLFSLFFYRPLVGRWIWLVSVPFLASLFFIFHPIHTEAVANIKGRDEIMSLLGSLAALYFSLRYLKFPKISNLAAMSLMMFLAVLSKENAITWLAIIPASLWVFTKASKKDYLKIFLWLTIPVLWYLVIRYQVIGYFLSSGVEITNIMNNPFAGMSGAEKNATVFYTLLMYIKLLIFPHPLTHDYYPYQIPIMNWGNIWVLLSFVLHVALAVYAVIGTYRKKIGAYAVFVYLASLSIVSNLPFTVGTFMNERFIYAASLGFCLLLAYLIIHHLNKKSYIAGLLISIIILLAYGFKTWERIPAWMNTLSLNEAAITVSKNSARANLFAGTALYNEKALKTDDSNIKLQIFKEAQIYIHRALEIHPTYGDALHMRGGIASAIYKIDRDLSSLLKEFYETLRYRPLDGFVYEYLAYLNKTVGTNPELIEFYHRVGYDLFQQENFNANGAGKALSTGLSVAPNNARLLFDMAQLQYALGNKGAGDNYLNKARSIDPSIK